MAVMQMKLALTLATIVIGLAIVGCKEKAVEPTAGNAGNPSKLTGKLQNAGENSPEAPAVK